MALIFPTLTTLQRFTFRPTALASGLPIFLAILNSPLIKFDSPLETNLISILKSLSTWNFKIGSFAWLKLIIIFLLACKYERSKGTIRFGVILNLISVFSGLPYILIGKIFKLEMSVQGLVYWINILWIALPFNDLYKLNEFTSFLEIFGVKFVGVLLIFLTSINDFNWLVFITSTFIGTLYYFKPEIFDQKLNLKSDLFLKIELLKYWTNSERPLSNINLYSLLKLIKIDYLTEKEMQQRENIGHHLESQTDSSRHSLIYEEDENDNLRENNDDDQFDLEPEVFDPVKKEGKISKLEDLEQLEDLESDTFPLPPLIFQDSPKPRSRKGTLTKADSYNVSPVGTRKNTLLKNDIDGLKSNIHSPKKTRSRTSTIGKKE